jgi:hypothetical protein
LIIPVSENRVELTTQQSSGRFAFPDAGPGIKGSLYLRNYQLYNLGEVGIYATFDIVSQSLTLRPSGYLIILHGTVC